MNRSIYPIAAAALAIASGPARAETVLAEAGQIAKILQAEDYRVESKETEGRPYLHVSFEDDSPSFNVIFYGCDTRLLGTPCDSIQFFGWYDDDNGFKPEWMAEWNAEYRFARAYIDADGDAALAMDVDLEAGGMSRELFLDNLAYWTSLYASYGKLLYDKAHPEELAAEADKAAIAK